MDKLKNAITFAYDAHKGTYRKNSDQPYIFHPVEVLSLASYITNDEDILCAAVLHDTVEDTEATIEEIREQFGDRIADMVSVETEDKRGQVNKKGTWEIRKQENIDKIKNCNSLGAKIVCLCDKISNLRSFHILYLQHGEDMWKIFNMNDPLMHYWYYNTLKDALVELKDYAIYKEYCFLIDTMFDKYKEKKQ